jgi:hypothetical protein
MTADPSQRIYLLEIACRHASTPTAILSAAKSYEAWVFGENHLTQPSPSSAPDVIDLEELIDKTSKLQPPDPEEIDIPKPEERATTRLADYEKLP